MRKTLALALALALAAAACGGKSSSPTTPSAPPTPVNNTRFFLHYQSDPTPAAPSLSVTDIPDAWKNWQMATDEIALSINANGVQRVSGLNGYLMFDPSIVEFSGWAEGDFLKQTGSLVKWDLHDYTGRIYFDIGVPTSAEAVNGSGSIVVVFLKRVTGANASATTRLQWDHPGLEQPGSPGGCQTDRDTWTNPCPTRASGGRIAVALE
jgi:hypothetical protein